MVARIRPIHASSDMRRANAHHLTARVGSALGMVPDDWRNSLGGVAIPGVIDGAWLAAPSAAPTLGGRPLVGT